MYDLAIIELLRYINLEDIKKINEEGLNELVEEIKQQTNELNFDDFNPFLCITGVPGSGKSTTAKTLSVIFGKDIISTDDFFKIIRKQWQEGKYKNEIIAKFYKNNEVKLEGIDLASSESFTSKGQVDLFKELELRLFVYFFLNGDFKDKILDLGGSVMLQPEVIALLSNARTFNLEIDAETRVNRLVHDFLRLPNKRVKYRIKVENDFSSVLLKEDLDEKKEENKKNIMNKLRELYKKILETKNCDYNEYLEMFEKSDLVLQINEKFGVNILTLFKQSMGKIDGLQGHRIKFNRKSKYTVNGCDAIIEIIKNEQEQTQTKFIFQKG